MYYKYVFWLTIGSRRLCEGDRIMSSRAIRGTLRKHTAKFTGSRRLGRDDLVRTTVAAFRRLLTGGNVQTVCRRQSGKGQRLRDVFDPIGRNEAFSPLAANIVELLCAERGASAPALKTYFHAVLGKRLSLEAATRLSLHIADRSIADQRLPPLSANRERKPQAD